MSALTILSALMSQAASETKKGGSSTTKTNTDAMKKRLSGTGSGSIINPFSLNLLRATDMMQNITGTVQEGVIPGGMPVATPSGGSAANLNTDPSTTPEVAYTLPEGTPGMPPRRRRGRASTILSGGGSNEAMEFVPGTSYKGNTSPVRFTLPVIRSLIQQYGRHWRDVLGGPNERA